MFDLPPIHGIPSQGATIAWDEVRIAQPKGDEDHDSDSSGSGGIISTHRRSSPKRTKKHQRALGPLPNFSLGNLQPISPGIVDIPGHQIQQQQHHLSADKKSMQQQTRFPIVGKNIEW